MSRERLTIQKGGMLRYRYRAGGCMDFDFHLLCEVGEPYQPWFRAEIARRGLKVETRDVEWKPTPGMSGEVDPKIYVADFVVKE